MPSERKSFAVQYRAGRRPRRMSLGPSTVPTCDQARTRAITIIAAVRNGEEPSADRATKRNAVTVPISRGNFGNNGAYIIVAAWKPGPLWMCNLVFALLPRTSHPLASAVLPQCFRSASGRFRNANSVPWDALQVTDNTLYFCCGDRI